MNEELKEEQSEWYCLRCKTLREYRVACQVEQSAGIETYCPRIRTRKSTPRGPVWYEEALFPGYFFAKFPFAEKFRMVSHAWGVTGIVRFGARYASLPDSVIAALRQRIGDKEPLEIQTEYAPGERVQIEEGPLRGLSAVVLRPLPAVERVRVMLDFMGSRIEVDMKETGLTPLDAPSAKAKALYRRVTRD